MRTAFVVVWAVQFGSTRMVWVVSTRIAGPLICVPAGMESSGRTGVSSLCLSKKTFLTARGVVSTCFHSPW